MPVVVADIQNRPFRSVTGRVDQNIDTAPALRCPLDQRIQGIAIKIGARNTKTPELDAKRFPSARRRQNADLEAVLRVFDRQRFKVT